MKVLGSIPNLRRGSCFRCILGSLAAAKDRFGVAIVHFSVQRTHIHLLVEAQDKQSLSRGMQGLGVRLARRLNKLLRRRGTVFKQRYHARIVRDSWQAKNVLSYVLNNARRHAAQAGWYYAKNWFDPCSSAASFPGWSVPPQSRGPPALAPPRTWLLSIGWLMWGLLNPWTIPGQRTKS
jgi:REP element-mobilizing transposase RayT